MQQGLSNKKLQLVTDNIGCELWHIHPLELLLACYEIFL